MNRCRSAAAFLLASSLWPVLAPAASGQEELPPDPAPPIAETASTLTIATWGGAYADSQSRVYFEPFRKETDIAVEVVPHSGDLAALKTGEGAAAQGWDVIDVNTATLEHACTEGLLETIDPDALAPAGDGTAAKDDFLSGALHECGVGSVAWSSVIAFDKRVFDKTGPNSAADFFDLRRFPGKRALPEGPRYTLELALIADGVAPEHVYRLLETQTGVEQAFRVLDRIKDEIIWWDSGEEPLKLMAARAVTMAVAYNGRLFSGIVADRRDFGLVWDGQIYDFDFWAIPKSSPNKNAALRFITFATQPDRMARQTRWFPYGPVRKSALPLVGKHAEVNVKMADFIPTSHSNFKRALRFDAAWWREHGDALKERFEAWIAQEELEEKPAGAAPEEKATQE